MNAPRTTVRSPFRRQLSRRDDRDRHLLHSVDRCVSQASGSSADITCVQSWLEATQFRAFAVTQSEKRIFGLLHRVYTVFK